ncbi:MAG: gamma-glutamylcyclotransferase [Burkholderiales bacterium]|nr:gamma-glutamylcyclotransferase [Burkholderiales bacterium]
MWDPRMPYRARSPALAFGYHRSLCVYSSLWRGTPERPGLVLGLDLGGACRGVAYRIAAADVRRVLASLWEREMREHEIVREGVSRAVYLPRVIPVRLRDRRLRSLAFVVDRRHPGYAGTLPLARTAQLVATRRGERGPNLEYLARTVTHLAALGVRDRRLQRVLEAARRG